MNWQPPQGPCRICGEHNPVKFSVVLGHDESLLISIGTRKSEMFGHLCSAECLLSYVDDWQAKMLAKHLTVPLARKGGV